MQPRMGALLADPQACSSTLCCLFELNKQAGQTEASGVLQALGSSVPWLHEGWEEEEKKEAGASSRPPSPCSTDG